MRTSHPKIRVKIINESRKVLASILQDQQIDEMKIDVVSDGDNELEISSNPVWRGDIVVHTKSSSLTYSHELDDLVFLDPSEELGWIQACRAHGLNLVPVDLQRLSRGEDLRSAGLNYLLERIEDCLDPDKRLWIASRHLLQDFSPESIQGVVENCIRHYSRYHSTSGSEKVMSYLSEQLAFRVVEFGDKARRQSISLGRDFEELHSHAQIILMSLDHFAEITESTRSAELRNQAAFDVQTLYHLLVAELPIISPHLHSSNLFYYALTVSSYAPESFDRFSLKMAQLSMDRLEIIPSESPQALILWKTLQEKMSDPRPFARMIFGWMTTYISKYSPHHTSLRQKLIQQDNVSADCLVALIDREGWAECGCWGSSATRSINPQFDDLIIALVGML